MDKAQEVYDKVRSGDSVTTTEVLFGIEFFSDLEQQLRKCGPVFHLAANEAGDVYQTLNMFLIARTRTRTR